jgi:hypothetical protein
MQPLRSLHAVGRLLKKGEWPGVRYVYFTEDDQLLIMRHTAHEMAQAVDKLLRQELWFRRSLQREAWMLTPHRLDLPPPARRCEYHASLLTLHCCVETKTLYTLVPADSLPCATIGTHANFSVLLAAANTDLRVYSQQARACRHVSLASGGTTVERKMRSICQGTTGA